MGKKHVKKNDDPRSDTKTAASRSEWPSQAAHLWRQEDMRGVAQQGVSTEPTEAKYSAHDV